MDGQIGQAIVTPDDYHHRQEAAWNAFLEKKEKSWVVSCWTPRRRNDDIHGPPTRDVWKAVGHPPPPPNVMRADSSLETWKIKKSGGPLDFFIGIPFFSLIIKTTTQIEKFKRGIGRRGEGVFDFISCFRLLAFISSPCCVQSRWLDPTFDPPPHPVYSNLAAAGLAITGTRNRREFLGAHSPVWLRHFISGWNQIPLKSPPPCPFPGMLKSNTRRYEPQI